MPRRDRTGPSGAGQMTGRGAGNCTGNDKSGSNNPGSGPGMAVGCGQGRGAGRGFKRTGSTKFTPVSPEKDVLTFPPNTETPEDTIFSAVGQLKNEIQSLSESLGTIHSRINALEDGPSSEDN